MSEAKDRKVQRICRIFSTPVEFCKLYCEQGSIHGLAYFVKKGLVWLEKCLWIVLVVTSIGFSIMLGLESLDRFNTKSVVVSIEKDYYYWNTSLPSLTICPMGRINRDKSDAYCSDNKIEAKDEFFNFIESLANSTYFNLEDIQGNAVIDSLRIDPKDYMELIFNLTDDLTRNEIDDLRARTTNDVNFIHVEQILTEFGICYTTNNILANNLSAKYLITGKYPEENQLERQRGVFHNFRYWNLFDGEINYNFLGFGTPIMVYLHDPYDVMSYNRITFPYTDEAVELEAQAMEVVASEDFEKNTRITQRHCRFPSESNLTHFPIYTKNLCMQDCRLNIVYDRCACIPHFYPNRISNPKPVCDYMTLKNCVSLLKVTFHDMQRKVQSCYCLPNCVETKVILEKSRVQGDTKFLMGSLGCTLIVKKFPLYRFRRQILFTFTDLLVSIGGTAGFFLGFSVLGAVEIVYYFTLRFFWYLRGYK